ncbi:TraB/GumN family protein [Sphingorhabdus contaminans]|uniref:TraB/GumN family protein n=1 Tax=Sphingorhabdus contaminans TaxID=1343899 RepID=UPI003D2A6FEF
MSPKYKALMITAAMALSPACFAQDAPTEAPAAVQALDPVKAAPPAIKDVDPALWVVKDEDTTIYLFGTVHILKPNLGWFDDGVKQAFEGSDKLVLEMVEPSAAESQALFGKLAIDKSGKTLRSKMSDADRAVYEKAMAKAGLPAEALDPFDPWAAAVTLSVISMQKQGFDINSGVEKQLTAAANATKKPIAGVETMEFQLGVFDSMPENEQIRFLIETAKVVESSSNMMDKMVELWGAPDPDGLGQLMNEGLTSRALYDALLTRRNANWAKWIKAEMDKPGTTFMAVGAGHLSGPTSVQNLLQAYGLSAVRVAY